MRLRFAFGALLVVAASADAQSIRVAVDPRAEILWAMLRTAGVQDFARGQLQPYLREMDSAFAHMRNHPVAAAIREARTTYGINYNSLTSLAVHVSDPIEFRERSPFDTSSTLDARWRGAESRAFLASARLFARDGRVSEFLRQQAPRYDSASVRMQRLVATMEARWFQTFFGEDAGALVVAPLLANSGGSFGTRYHDSSRREAYAYMSLGTADSLGFPVVPADLLPVIVHELNHSFVYHLVPAHHSELEEPGTRIYAALAGQMRSQSYTGWQTLIDESLVRASVIRYLRAAGGAAEAANEARSQRGIGFIWIDELTALLGEYEAERTRYPTLASFMPRVVEYYRALAPRIESMVAAFDAQRPMIVASTPARDAVDVDPAVQEIVVRFDRPMGDGPSLASAGGALPEIVGYGFGADSTTFTLRVKLQPGQRYGLRFHGFKFASRDGYPLKEYILRFTTRR